MKKDIESDPGPIEGQTTFPGFEDPAQPKPEAGAASEVQEDKPASEVFEINLPINLDEMADITLDDFEKMCKADPERAEAVLNGVVFNEIISSPIFQIGASFSKLGKTTREVLEKLSDEIRKATAFNIDQSLIPYIKAEIEARQKNGDTRDYEALPLPQLENLGILDAARKRYSNQKAAIAREGAKASGAIMRLERLSFPSLKGTERLFDTDSIFLLKLDDPLEETAIVTDDGGLNPIIANDKKYRGRLESVEIGEIGSFLEAFLEKEKIEDHTAATNNDEVRFYLPGYYSGTNPRGQEQIPSKGAREARFRSMVARHERNFMVLPGGSVYRYIVYKGYDPSTDTVLCSMPAFARLLDIMQSLTKRAAAETGSKALPMPYNQLLHKEAMTENIHGQEIALYITTWLLQSGTNEQTTREVYYSTILSRCPQLKTRLATIEEAQRTRDYPNPEKKITKNPGRDYNNTLRYAFESGFRILKKKSDFSKYYPGWTIATVSINRDKKPGARRETNELLIPTKSTLNEMILKIIPPKTAQ